MWSEARNTWMRMKEKQAGFILSICPACRN